MPEAYPPEVERYVQEKIASGEFASESEFFIEATQLYRELEQRHTQLRADVAHASDQLSRGEGIELNDDAALRAFFNDIKARGRERARAGQGGERAVTSSLPTRRLIWTTFSTTSPRTTCPPPSASWTDSTIASQC